MFNLKIARNKIKLYHGTNTGPNNERLFSFLTEGVDPTVAIGHGQQMGFYTSDNFEIADNYATTMIGRYNIGLDTKTNAEKGGKPMIVEIEVELNPKNFNFDIEANPEIIYGEISILKRYEAELNYELLKNPLFINKNRIFKIEIKKIELQWIKNKFGYEIKIIYNKNLVGPYETIKVWPDALLGSSIVARKLGDLLFYAERYLPGFQNDLEQYKRSVLKHLDEFSHNEKGNDRFDYNYIVYQGESIFPTNIYIKPDLYGSWVDYREYLNSLEQKVQPEEVMAFNLRKLKIKFN